jgi:hypothetical protein
MTSVFAIPSPSMRSRPGVITIVATYLVLNPFLQAASSGWAIVALKWENEAQIVTPQ